AEVVKTLREREVASGFRHRAVEGGVEASVLLRFRQKLLCLPYERNGSGNMDGSELGGGFEFFKPCVVDQAMLAEMRPAVDDAVAGGGGGFGAGAVHLAEALP